MNEWPEICMCLWKRIKPFPKIIRALENQTHKHFTLNVWCNTNLEEKKKIKELLQKSTLKYKLYGDGENHGSKARFWIAPMVKRNPIIFLDDDQIPRIDFVEYMLKMYIKNPNSVQGWWCRTFSQDKYWGSLVKNNLETLPVDYIGTGGMILDKKIVLDDRLQNIPDVCAKIEDLYLCYIARKFYNCRLLKISKKIKVIDDKHNQSKKLKKEKEDCFKFIRENGYLLLNEL